MDILQGKYWQLTTAVRTLKLGFPSLYTFPRYPKTAPPPAAMQKIGVSHLLQFGSCQQHGVQLGVPCHGLCGHSRHKFSGRATMGTASRLVHV